MARYGGIAAKSSEERKQVFKQLFDGVVLPQRRRLLQYRDHTWQSAYVDDDGYLAEMVASIVIGVPGTNRRGVTRTSGDLADGTEVKKGYRLDPNIDFVLRGRMRRRSQRIELETIPAELVLAGIRSQLNSNACSIQAVVAGPDGHQLGGELGKSVASHALVAGAEGGLSFLRLSKSRSLPPIDDGHEFDFCIRQERGHINFGNRSRAQLDGILAGHPVLVFYGHDRRGRFQVSVIRCALSGSERKDLLDQVFGLTPDTPRQVQPYLYPDNIRDSLADSKKHSVATALGGRLLAHAVEARSGLEIVHWDPSGTVSVLDAAELLTAEAPPEDCPPFRHEHLDLNLSDEQGRAQASSSFFEDCMDGYYQGLHPYCELTATSRNIAFGNLAQHLVSLVAGVLGTRSGARGADLVEDDGSTPSEVKLATGQAGGDAMDTEDSPRLTLGWDQQKMVSWKRLFAVRIVDGGGGLRVLVHAPTEETMKEFRRQVSIYFSGRTNNGSGGLQYHAMDPFPHDGYGPQDRRLSFVRVGDFQSGLPAGFPHPVPEW